MSTLSNEAKNENSMALISKGGTNKTWDEAVETWDEATYTWDQPEYVLSAGLEAKNENSLSLEAKL